MAIEGRLRELALSDVFQLLELSRKTGILTVHSDAHERPAVVRFADGMITGAESPDAEDRLGRLLLRSGRINEADLGHVLREQRTTPSIPLGATVVRLGLATPVDVARHLSHQVEETVYELFRWRDGSFRFEEGAPPPDGVVSVRLAPQSLLMEAARRTDEWSALAPDIPHRHVVPVLADAGGEPAPLDLQPFEWEVLAEVDGERTLRQIAAELGRSDVEVARAVFGLVASRTVTLTEPGSAAAAVAASHPLHGALADAERLLREGKHEQAIELADRLLGDHPENAELHVVAGRALLRLARWEEAAARLGWAVRLDPLAALAHFHLGFAAARTGDLGRAELAWSTYLRLPDARGARGEVARRGLQAAVALRTLLDSDLA